MGLMDLGGCLDGSFKDFWKAVFILRRVGRYLQHGEILVFLLDNKRALRKT